MIRVQRFGPGALSVLALAFVALLLASPAAAQSTIAGAVTDATGAVLPGVTVEASSPALIEKVRTASTNDSGRYSIVDLRPGVYVVTFSLQGFSTVRREAIEVAANVAVPLNIQLRVGALEETITVTGATPVVDVQQAAQRQVLSREMLDSLPTARSYLSTGVIVPTVKLSRPEMGGINTGQGAYLSSRGKSSNEDAVEIDGLDVRISNGVSQSGYNNFAMVQDVTYQTSAIAADTGAGGVRINMVPRDGGNTFGGDLYLGGSRGSWQANNLTPELILKGLTTPDRLEYLFEATPAFGGPIQRDKLWFFASGRFNEVSVHPAGAHYRDGSDAFTLNAVHNLSGRLTYQATPRNKITAYIDKTFKSQKETTTFTLGAANPAGVDWETATAYTDPSNMQLMYAKWTSPVSNRFLLESGFVANIFNTNFNGFPPGIRKERGTPEWYAGAPKQDIVLATLTGGPAASEQYAWQPSYSLSGAGSYVTGSHTAKVGVQWRRQLIRNHSPGGNADILQRYRSRVPDSVLALAVPYIAAFNADETGLYAMDTWSINRLTVTPGIRIDYFSGGISDSASEPGRFVPGRAVSAFAPVDPFLDFSPRIGVVYDLFGDAKTALKFSANKYVLQLAATYFSPYNPISATQDPRNWFDTDLVPGTSTRSGRSLPTNADNIAQDNEIGPSSNTLFGRAADRRVDPDLTREYSWDYSASVQHELLPRVSVSFGWYISRNYNQQRTRNTLQRVSDYTPFQTVNPQTGQPMTLFNLDPAKNVADRVDASSEINRRLYTGYESSVSLRRENGAQATFGWAMERNERITCDNEDPNLFIYCDETGDLFQELGAVSGMPFLHEFKAAGSHPLPWQFKAAVSLISYPGQPLTVLWAVPASVYPNGQRTVPVTVPLIEPGTKYLERWNQLDVNLKRPVSVGRFKFEPSFEIYNLLNSSVVLGEIQNFGALGRPTSTIQGRLLKLSAIVRF